MHLLYTAKKQEQKILSNALNTNERNMKKQKDTFTQQVKNHGFARNDSQIIMVMIGKTGHGKSTLCNRICGDKSRKGNEGPFGASAKKNKPGTTDVVSHITTAPFEKKDDDINTNEGKEDGNNPTDENENENEENKAPDEIELEIIDLEDADDMKQDAPSLLIVDTPGWGDVEEDNRELSAKHFFWKFLNILLVTTCDNLLQLVTALFYYTVIIKLAENVHSLVINKDNEENHPLYQPTDKESQQYNDEDGYLKALIKEVISNGFASDLCLKCSPAAKCKHNVFNSQWSILQIVDQKLRCNRHSMIQRPLKRGEMLALILYTG